MLINTDHNTTNKKEGAKSKRSSISRGWCLNTPFSIFLWNALDTHIFSYTAFFPVGFGAGALLGTLWVDDLLIRDLWM